MFGLITRHLHHETRIESGHIVYRIDEKYDMSYSVGRMANPSFDAKRLSYICVAYSRTFSYI